MNMRRVFAPLPDAARRAPYAGVRLPYAAIALFFAIAACAGSKPEPIIYNADACDVCRMQISDPRFGAEILTNKGRTIKFDSIDCLLSYYKEAAAAHDVKSVWVSDFLHPGEMLDASTARFVDIGPGRAPMGRGIVAVATNADVALLGLMHAPAIKSFAELL